MAQFDFGLGLYFEGTNTSSMSYMVQLHVVQSMAVETTTLPILEVKFSNF
jgi:hypothetical protein